jgi:hypothetical protein
MSRMESLVLTVSSDGVEGEAAEEEVRPEYAKERELVAEDALTTLVRFCWTSARAAEP